jgi:nuclear pore complex protein Nup160
MALRHSSVRTLVTKMCEFSSASELVKLPFIGLQDAVDDILAQKCQSIVEVTVGVPYHKILYAWRIKRSDFRGAAAISLERLQKLQQAGEGDRELGEGGLETPVTKQYVALINALSCVDPKQAWIFQEEPPSRPSAASAKKEPKRKVVTLEDIRKAYQEELDRITAIENDQFAFAEGDEMDVL